MSALKALALSTAAALLTIGSSEATAQQTQKAHAPWVVRKRGVDLDLRSAGRTMADAVRAKRLKTPNAQTPPGKGTSAAPDFELLGGNVQANDPALDHIQIFPGFRPWVFTTNSETSVAAFGQNVVATYNTAAGAHLVPDPVGGLTFDQLFFSGVSAAADGGRTWSSGFMPPLPGSIFTLGDPAIGVDRHGNFFFSSLGADALGRLTIQANSSTDGGQTFGPAVLVLQDDGADKDWLAVGPDPIVQSRDNVYVTWSSFQSTGIQLRLGRSIDGGATWTTKVIFAPGPDPDPTAPQNSLSFSNPVVDRVTGRLYVPFVHFSFSDQDFIRILISDDAGETFHFARFDVPGAPSPTLLPITQPGHLNECGAFLIEPPPPDSAFFVPNVRLVIHAGPDVGGSLTGLPRYRRASRLIVQPALAAHAGVLYLAWSNSTSRVFGDPKSGSNVLFVRSDDGGESWTVPVPVNPVSAGRVQHVLPALATGGQGGEPALIDDVHILYYTQHGDGTVSVDLSTSHDRGNSFPAHSARRISAKPSGLPPTNIPVPSEANPFDTANYDNLIAQCYSLGEYLSITSNNGTIYTLWGDLRNRIRQPVSPLDPISGKLHPQEDVFFQAISSESAFPTVAEAARQGRGEAPPDR